MIRFSFAGIIAVRNNDNDNVIADDVISLFHDDIIVWHLSDRVIMM